MKWRRCLAGFLPLLIRCRAILLDVLICLLSALSLIFSTNNARQVGVRDFCVRHFFPFYNQFIRGKWFAFVVVLDTYVLRSYHFFIFLFHVQVRFLRRSNSMTLHSSFSQKLPSSLFSAISVGSTLQHEFCYSRRRVDFFTKVYEAVVFSFPDLFICHYKYDCLS